MKNRVLGIIAAAVIAAGAFTSPARTALGSAAAVSEAAAVTAPAASRKSGTYYLSSGSFKVTLSCADSGAKIYYSLNGGTYRAYVSPLTIKKNGTLKTYSVSADGSKSAVKTYKYKLVPKVTITPAEGEYNGAQTVTLSSGVSGVKFYYTLDGSKPTASSALYTAKGIKLTEDCRLRILVTKSGWTKRYITKDYVINGAAAPEMIDLLEDYTEKYGYNTLSGSEKQVYARIFEAVKNHADSADVSDLKVKRSEIDRIYWAFDYDNPQFFWLGNGYSYSYDLSGNLLSVSAAYSRTKSEAEQISKKFDAAAEEVLSEAAKAASEYDRVKIIHDWLINKTEYKSYGPVYISEADGAIVNGQALCEGYSKAFMYLAQAAGIPTICVSGKSNGAGHMWNMVKLGGQWYHIDVTWDDPISWRPMLVYDYFLVSDKTILSDHSLDSKYTLPSAPSDYKA
ncbi:MAG: chitobiase/beta-hexosaminidase C-terminal domain-containing protein [Oscillospiraceae bacterium]